MRYKIEKIKVMGWTYMAACGLEVDHYADFSIDMPVKPPEADSETRRRSSGDYLVFTYFILQILFIILYLTVLTVHFGSTEDDEMSGDTASQPFALVQDAAVLVMTEFALDLLRIMYDLRYNYVFSEYDTFQSGSLKIGGFLPVHRYHFHSILNQLTFLIRHLPWTRNGRRCGTLEAPL